MRSCRNFDFSVFRDRFLIVVVLITATVVLGMTFLHLTVGRGAGLISIWKATPAEAPSGKRLPSTKSTSLPSGGPFRVARVIDGDTFVLENGETVRLIGIDAPETHHPEIPVQRFGEEATGFLRSLIEGLTCTLQYEPGEIRDQFGRLLAYVFVGNRLVNAEMIRRGYAYAYTVYPFSREALFLNLEQKARQKQYGLWSLSLRDGRIANLVGRYESLNMEGRKRLDEILEELAQKFPLKQKEKVITAGEDTK